MASGSIGAGRRDSPDARCMREATGSPTPTALKKRRRKLPHDGCEFDARARDLIDQLTALRPVLVRIARQQLRNDAWADDAVSDTLVAAIEGIDQFQAHSRLKTWVIGILRFKIFDIFRAHRREQPLVFEIDDDADGDGPAPVALETLQMGRLLEEAPEARIAHTECVDRVRQLMDQLPADQRKVLILRAWSDLPIEDICDAMSITRSNASVLLHRARRGLVRQLDAGNRGRGVVDRLLSR